MRGVPSGRRGGSDSDATDAGGGMPSFVGSEGVQSISCGMAPD